MATTTETILDAIRDGLRDHLPTLVLAQGMPALATDDIDVGTMPIHPTTRTHVEVDFLPWEQEGGLGADSKRHYEFTTTAIIAAEDPKILTRYLARYGDLITSVLEQHVDITGLGGSALYLSIEEGDPTPPFKEGNALFRAVTVTCRLMNKIRSRGDT